MPHDGVRDPADLALLQLRRYLCELDEAALPAVAGLRETACADPRNPSLLVALGFALDAAGRPADALAVFERAAQMSPQDREVAVFILTLRSELGPEIEALRAVKAAGDRMGVDLDGLRRELAAAGMPGDSRTLVQNEFAHARNFLRSRLLDGIERAEHEADPEGRARRDEAFRRQCIDGREELSRTLRPEHVPPSLLEAVPWAQRLGVGDPACRALLFDELTPREGLELAAVVGRLAPEAHARLDSFADDGLSAEAASLMYPLLGVEEHGGS